MVLTAGNFGVIDVFDQNPYGSDPRTQFMNWSFLTHGSFDYPADSRGYNWGAALEYVGDGWSARFGHFLLPLESNGRELDTRLFQHYGDVLELEKRYALAGRPGQARLLLWRNKANMGSFNDAVAYGQANGVTPDLAAVRREHSKLGIGVAMVQEVTDALGGVLPRQYVGRQDRDLRLHRDRPAGGWRRHAERQGLGAAQRRSGCGGGGEHARLIAPQLPGGGRPGRVPGRRRAALRPEQVFEIYYSFAVWKTLSLSPDFQYIRNPGYNRDRGPAKFYGIRAHAEF